MIQRTASIVAFLALLSLGAVLAGCPDNAKKDPSPAASTSAATKAAPAASASAGGSSGSGW